jgi:hypothetical protein
MYVLDIWCFHIASWSLLGIRLSTPWLLVIHWPESVITLPSLFLYGTYITRYPRCVVLNIISTLADSFSLVFFYHALLNFSPQFDSRIVCFLLSPSVWSCAKACLPLVCGFVCSSSSPRHFMIGGYTMQDVVLLILLISWAWTLICAGLCCCCCISCGYIANAAFVRCDYIVWCRPTQLSTTLWVLG